ncbi:SDR family oxidoreductase [Bradyrhizobium brasilense]|uniref:SDR family oxidoreductase n=1 Tax=Bradyrhizobium brasilense TaxID=1419277 RepID=A0ABY8JCV5_9BRAD|nr:SDR family oxidoreductase [Bradyrhizobium brasilense]WFU62554.1 SDR family oxidoreductase [Bradyrhizobium brasilense]
MRTAIEGKRVIVTAGANGIGRAIVDQLADAGARVATCDVSEHGIEQLRKQLPEVRTELVDVRDAAAQAKFLEDAISYFDGLDALINNAGISGPTSHIEDVCLLDWQSVFRVNVESHFVASKIVVPYLRKQRDGALIFISSTAGRLGFPLRTPYAASKWALVGLMKSLAMELGPDGVRVNAIMPGVVSGDRINRVIAAKAEAVGLSFDEMHRKWLDLVSLRRMIPPKEIAEMIHFLISDAGRNISGQSLSLCGNTETLR